VSVKRWDADVRVTITGRVHSPDSVSANPATSGVAVRLVGLNWVWNIAFFSRCFCYKLIRVWVRTMFSFYSLWRSSRSCIYASTAVTFLSILFFRVPAYRIREIICLVALYTCWLQRHVTRLVCTVVTVQCRTTAFVVLATPAPIVRSVGPLSLCHHCFVYLPYAQLDQFVVQYH